MSAPDANGWMPIETAPKDGDEVLVYRKPVYRRSIRNRHVAVFSKERWVVAGTTVELHNVSHWQPLPKPPLQSEAPQ